MFRLPLKLLATVPIRLMSIASTIRLLIRLLFSSTSVPEFNPIQFKARVSISTLHRPDQDLHQTEPPRERLSKRTFLGSFALVCATKNDGDSMSAACIKEGAPEGTTIQIASY